MLALLKGSASSGQKQIILSTVAVAILLSATTAIAYNWYGEYGHSAPPPQPLQDEDHAFEFGIEYAGHYSGPWWDLPAASTDADATASKFANYGWTERYRYGNAAALGGDFGANDDGYVDNVDLVYVRSHGSYEWDWPFLAMKHGPLFPSSDSHVLPGASINRWGTKDLEWIAFNACNVLNDDSIGSWAKAMNGVHLILGSSADMYDSAYFGTDWALAMFKDGAADRAQSVKQAWFTAFDQSQPHGKQVSARVIAPQATYGDEYVWGQGTGPIADPTTTAGYVTWEHSVGSRAPNETNDLSTIPVFGGATDVDQEYAQSIANKIGLWGEVEQYGDNWYLSSGNDTLMVTSSGQFFFYKLDNLWMSAETEPDLPTNAEAAGIAEDYLVSHNLLPADAYLADVNNDTQVAYDSDNNTTESSIVLNRQVVFQRGSGQLTVMGTGGRLKVYVGDGGQIWGVAGGWREFAQTGSTSVITAQAAQDRLIQNGSQASLVALSTVGNLSITGHTMGYYAFSNLTVVPVYIFDATFSINNTNVSSDYLYVPASDAVAPPIANITSPGDNSSYGTTDTIDFVGEAHLGASPMTYAWFSDIDGSLGTGTSISAQLSAATRDGEPVPHTIRFQVTDAAGFVTVAQIEVMVT